MEAMAVVVLRADGEMDTYESGYLHATCGTVITSREACPHCETHPFLETLDRAVAWTREEDDGSLTVLQGNRVAGSYPAGIWRSFRKF